MSEIEDWGDLPLSPDMHKYIEASAQQSLKERRTQIQFAAILCRCQPWYNHENPAPAQHACTVHTTIMFDKRGDWL